VIWLVALSVVVTALAWAVARRRADHRPIAWFLTAALAADVLRWPLRVFVIAPARAARIADEPFAGWVRATWHVHEALFLVWPVGIAALFVWLFLRRRPWAIGVACAALVAYLVATYPETRGAVLQRWYLGAELAAVAVSVGACVQWLWRRESPKLPHACAIMIGCVEVALFIGPFRGNVFTTWDLARLGYVILYVALAVVQGGSLWGSGSTTRKLS
jgi:hypothetical protein